MILPLSLTSASGLPSSQVQPSDTNQGLLSDNVEPSTTAMLTKEQRTVTQYTQRSSVNELQGTTQLGGQGGTLPLSNIQPDTGDGEADVAEELRKKPKDNVVLRGYATLQELRRKASDYRKGYLNWRQFKPKGARGETSDVFTGRAEQKPVESKFDLTAYHATPSDHPAVDVEAPRSIQGPGGVRIIDLLPERRGSRDIQAEICTKSSGPVIIPRPLKDPMLKPFSEAKPELDVPAAATPSPTLFPVTEPLTPGVGINLADVPLPAEKPLLDQQATDLSTLDVVKQADVDEDQWLRFYYNPFTPAEEHPAVPLKASTLHTFAESPHRQVSIPPYNRDPATVTHWLMHLGVGQFHRSHQLVYMDDILIKQHDRLHNPSSHNSQDQHQNHSPNPSCRDENTSPDIPLHEKWGYCGVGLMPFDRKMGEALRQQDLLYTVLARNNTTSSARVIGSIFEYIFALEELDQALHRLLSPKLRIVSLTITEKGYCQDVHGNLDFSNPFICHDLELLKDSTQQSLSRCPQSAIGFLYWGIRERRARQIPPFTVMSCDNLPENGQVAKAMVIAFAEKLDPDLAKWMSNTIRFPASMVDRITPSVGDEHREILAKDFGVLDAWPVVTEVFRQWVIEDDFPYGRPPWEAVGALLVNNVRPFELMKLRLLNGGHSVMAYISYLAGHRFVDDAISDIRISSFLRTYMDEVTSTIRNVCIEVERYKEQIVERFGNRLIKDTIIRVCEDGSFKFFNTVKDALTELLAEDRHILWTALGIAAFIMFLATAPSDLVKDARKLTLIPIAVEASSHPMVLDHISTFLREIFGHELGGHPRFVHHVALALAAIKYKSVESILKHGGVLEALFDQHLLSPSRLHQLVKSALDESHPGDHPQPQHSWHGTASHSQEDTDPYIFARFLNR